MPSAAPRALRPALGARARAPSAMTGSVWGDWGTTRLRLFRVVEGRVADRAEGRGIGSPDVAPRAELARLLAPWQAFGRPERIVLVGMAGSRGGLSETRYVPCPATRPRWTDAAARIEIDGIPTVIAAGLRFGNEDVMRGEEAQIFGAFARIADPGRECFVLPGTHSKWARTADGAITGFRTYPTGELFALLKVRSTLLRGARPGSADTDTDADEADGWQAGLALAQRGTDTLGLLFRTRAAQLLEARSATWAEAFLSGLLIGSEIRDALDAGLGGGDPVLVGDSALIARYAAAMVAFGMTPLRLAGDDCVLAGLEMLDVACR